MELFHSAEQQPTELQHSGSSVLWLGSALVVVWLVGAGRFPVVPVDSLLSNLSALVQTFF